MKNPHAIALGRLGGKAGRGPAKARDPEKMRRAAKARWEKAKTIKHNGKPLSL